METRRISDAARTALLDPANELVVSAAFVWELAIKVELGKLPLPLGHR
jgi:PIN domain nuclease of toxin-antitoxin system